MTRSSGLSINGPKPPLIMVNDVPVNNSILLSIDPSTVESIEVTKRINVRYGSQGANGVLSIYTKTGPLQKEVMADKNFQAINIMGYSRPRVYPLIEYADYHPNEGDPSQGDFRSTLYWDPNLIQSSNNDKIEAFFYASDLIGKYRVVVEGVIDDIPLRSEYQVIVDGY
jgi:hypothetical protein